MNDLTKIIFEKIDYADGSFRLAKDYHHELESGHCGRLDKIETQLLDLFDNDYSKLIAWLWSTTFSKSDKYEEDLFKEMKNIVSLIKMRKKSIKEWSKKNKVLKEQHV